MSFRAIRLTSFGLVSCIALLLAGCLPFPLGSPERSTVDPKLAGYWFARDDDKHTLLSMFPYDEHTYVLQAAEFKKTDDKYEPTTVQVYKAWLTTVKGATFITLEPLSQRLPSATADTKAYIVARLIPAADAMQVKGLDTDYPPLKTIKSAEDLRAVITDHLDEPKLYGGPTTYRHLDPDKDKDALEPMLKLFR